MIRKTVFFDRSRGGTNSIGKWVVIAKDDEVVEVMQFRCEYDARQAIGLPDGSMDPLYQPPNDETGSATVEIDVPTPYERS